ncbi:thyrotropin-releasing hormone receptor [Biomphalaria pfeifferi]|uniref:Thyrotropin-releasing hormone receptor n=1 Tax=Biomphalaria pfeifferi TaxID=112525 RepID=A0AAD8F7T3_BIOPF|nr:thyrotropin-releasing hormone receptor [Biomphalaria pfeifferi]
MAYLNDGSVLRWMKPGDNMTNLTWARQTSEREWFKAIDDMKPYLRNYMWLVCGFGLPGNILIIALILRMRSRGMSSYLIVYLAVFDSLALIAKLVQRNIFYSNVSLGNIGCKMVSIPEMSCASIANWTLVFISAERFLTVCYPLQRQRWLTDFRIKLILIVVPLFLIVYAISLNVVFQYETKSRCGTKYIKFYQYMVIPPITNIVAPFTVLLIFTIFVLKSIRSVSKKRSLRLKSVTSLKEPRKNSQSATQEMENTLSNIMLAAAVLFFAVNALYCVYTLIMFPVYVRNLTRSVTFTRYAALMISDWNHALNFYVYVLFSEGFRANLLRMMRSWSCCSRMLRLCFWSETMAVTDNHVQYNANAMDQTSTSSIV